MHFKMIKRIHTIIILLFATAPLQVFAGIGSPPSDFKAFTDTIIQIVNLIIPIFVALALIGFLWGISQTILHADSPEARKKGRDIAVYGIIALFVMLSLWGLLRAAQNTFF